MKTLKIFCWNYLFIAVSALGQSPSSYRYNLDLTNVVDDRVMVELIAPGLNSDKTTFYFPKIIPGTYSVADYGRFIVDLKAWDKRGNEMLINRENENEWTINNAKKLYRITYWVNDIIDDADGKNIYPMAGTNIEEGKNFVINTAGFLGYFENKKDLPVTLDVIRPKEFYGSTGLIAQKSDLQMHKIKGEVADKDMKRMDRFVVENYDRIIDSPLMYCKPDTAVIKVAGSEVLIGSYSPGNTISAQEIAETVREVLEAQTKYLGGKLPVDKYAFIFYFTDQPVTTYGALEHWYSSFYYMPDLPLVKMQQQLRDFAAHEFFHIVTPLNIHSEEIEHFEFNDPKMSQHLWLYEGVTEYFAGNVQVKYGLISQDEYLEIIRGKLLASDNFLDDVPFTDISKFTLDKYKNQYSNVYLKGALIGMCLDIKLRGLSNGKYGLQDLMADLSKQYGSQKPFNDDELFDDIERLTFPEIGKFLRQYVSGPERIPYKEIFEIVGITYSEEELTHEFTIGFNPSAIRVTKIDGISKLIVGDINGLTEQGRLLEFNEGDVLLKVNEKDIPDPGSQLVQFFESIAHELVEGETLTYSILRKDDAGVYQPHQLKSKIVLSEIADKHILSFKENISQEKMAVRKSWLSAE